VKRLIKPEGALRVALEEAPVPDPLTSEVLIRAEVSLISRGSEIWRRYVRQEAVDPAIMGYSLAGSVVQVGAQVEAFSMGERVAAVAPHAQYVSVEACRPRVDPPIVTLPGEVSPEAGTFWPLTTSAVMWMDEIAPSPDQTVVILGQGLVGSLCLQVLKARRPCRVIAVDTLPLRCGLAERFGADRVVDVTKEDPVEAVKRETGGGAEIVVEAVGGRAGARAFEQAVEMTRRGGLIQVIGLYEEAPLPLDSSKIQGKRILGGFIDAERRPEASDRAIDLLAEGKIQTEAMVTHRFPAERAPEAFDLLYNRLGEAMAVVLEWGDKAGR
jgi:threonine dehydrogenase-like Zn-dependent dehydrogenase